MSPAGGHRVLMLETIDEGAHARLAAGAEVVLSESPSEADTLSAARGAPFEALITRGKGRVTAALLDACPSLRWAARCGVGVDNIDVAAASERGVGVLNLPGANARTIAEHTVMLMLGVARGALEWGNAVREGRWQDRAGYDRDELGGRTVGVIGLGNIGRRVATIGRALGMRVVYADPGIEEPEFAQVELDALLGEADVITLHCSLTDQTRGLIGVQAIERMKRGAIVINTARGAIIDQAALTAALEGGRLGGFGADVLDVEPPGDDRLLRLANVIVTPHVGSLTKSTYTDMCVRTVENVLGVLAGESPRSGTLLNADALASKGL